MVLISVGFMSGLLVFRTLDAPYTKLILTLSSAVSVLLLLITVLYLPIKKRIPAVCIFFLLFLIPLRCGIVKMETAELNYDNALYTFGSGKCFFQGTVISTPAEASSYERKYAYIRLSSYTKDGVRYEDSSKIKLYFKESTFDPIEIFDTVEFYAEHLMQAPKYALREKSENALVFSAKVCTRTGTRKGVPTLEELAALIGGNIRFTADTIFSYNPQRASIVKGILTGDKDDFSPKMYTGFSDAGFMHIAAVSGMHVSILFAMISAVLSRLRAKRRTIAFVTVPAIFIFSAVSGFTPSSLRAAIMLSLSIASVFFGKEYDMLSALFFSALVILIISPYKLFTASFVLSFGATLGIALFYTPCKNLMSKRLRLPSFIADSISLSISAFLGTAPFCAAFFGNINLISILTNIWIIPVVTAAFTLSLSACMLHFFPFVSEHLLVYFCEPPLMIIEMTANLFYGTGIGKISFSYVPPAFYGLYAAFIIILIRLSRKNHVDIQS